MIKIKILIVDDEPDYCTIMKSYFQDKNYDVHLAYTLKDGLAMLEQVKPDILILDNNLPDGESFKHVNSIIARSPGLKIYFVSAYRQKTDANNFHGDVTVWEKPISLRYLETI